MPVPMFPPAPALLSTSTVWPSDWDRKWPIWRERRSALPPGAYGQINVMVLDGYLSWAQLKPAAGTSRPAAVVLRKLRRCMVLSPGLVVPRECRHATCRSAVLGVIRPL